MNGMSFFLISLSAFFVKVMILEKSLRRLKRIILKRVFYEFDNFDKLCESKAVKVKAIL